MKRFSSALLVSASLLAFAAPAYAQDAVSAENGDNEITVTGSRVIKNGDASPSPVTVVATEDLYKANPGSTLAEALNTLPVFAGSRGATSNPTTTGTASGGNGSANQLNLRNLGATRTLVLMDGKRVPPTLFNSAVDVDIIPQMLVKRVDVVTGGVSAVYGSDAVAGVVNYVIDNKFNGLRVDASYGLTQYGDGTRFDAGAAYGTDIGERGHFEVSYEYRKEGGIGRRSARDWLNLSAVTGAGTTANPYTVNSDLRWATHPFGGLISTGALAGQFFKTDGVLSTFNPGTATGTTGISVGGDGGYYDAGLAGALEGHQIFGRFDYDVTDNIHAYALVAANIKTNSIFADTSQLTNVNISRTNAFLSSSIQAQIPTSQATFRLSSFLSDDYRQATDADSNQWVYRAGLSGDGPIGWSLDYSRGISKLDTTVANVLNRQKLGAALDAVSSGGQIVCYAATQAATASAYANCVPLNPFGPTAASAGAMNYIMDTIHYQSTTKMDDIAGQITASPFELGAGPVNFALSGEWRKTAFTSHSDALPTTLSNCTSIRFSNCSSTAIVSQLVFGESPTPITQEVWELAGEFDAPILRDRAFFKSLSINGAARYTKYDVSGAYWTWKLGVAWELSDTLRLRATRSRDIRAPNLFELYAPQSVNSVTVADLLTNVSPSPRVDSRDQANPNLTAEIANILTVGAVWKPTRSLSFAVDYYKIDIANAVTQVQGQTPSFQRICYDSGGASPYCALQGRLNGFADTSAANVVQYWITTRTNFSKVQTWGVDFEANYNGSLFSRPMSVRLFTAWQPRLVSLQEGTTTVDQGGVAFGPGGLGATPKWRINASLRFKPSDHLTVDINERWRSSMKLSGDPDQVWVGNYIKSFATTALTLTWEPDRTFAQFQWFVSVQNLFNANPPLGSFEGNGNRAGLRDGFTNGDDPRGRSFTSGVKLKF